MIFVKTCVCGSVWEIDTAEENVILEPYPHIRCPHCGHWLELF